jgi:hypothetical protein
MDDPTLLLITAAQDTAQRGLMQYHEAVSGFGFGVSGWVADIRNPKP